MAVALHSNVGLMHATMPIFNAWCDRTPMIIFGATGPVDAHRRRPWIDWIHTSKDQAAVVRDYTKWDDQPASPQAAVESVLRANQITRSAIGLCKAIEPIDPMWIEDPLTVRYSEAWLELKRSTRVPLLAGEKVELVEGFRPLRIRQGGIFLNSC